MFKVKKVKSLKLKLLFVMFKVTCSAGEGSELMGFLDKKSVYTLSLPEVCVYIVLTGDKINSVIINGKKQSPPLDSG